jgi:DtxR family transcriptional regulator, Mn-dependent transcriptional regulator
MIRDNLTHAVEDYLKTIYDLTRDGERASTNQIAERMGVTAASASGMVQKLAATTPPLLEYEKHHGVTLTVDGEKIALEIIRYHRLLELFLQETLGFSWDQVHAEADRLEHVISPDVAERISQVLGEPVHDPHGHPIPTRDLKLPPGEPTLPLRDLRPGQQAYIRRVEDDDPGLLRYLDSIGLTPATRLMVLDYSNFDGNLQLEIGGRTVVLGPRITAQIFVEAIEPVREQGT